MFEPKIICFFCKWCTYTGADLAGTSRMKYKPHAVVIKSMCSSRVDAQHILKAFQEGIDGVLVGGCHFGDCHYISGNHLTYKRIGMLKRILPAFGIEPERLRLEWISAAEGRKLADVNDAFIEEIRALGPVSLRAGM